MIDRGKFTLDWITKISKENRNADKILVEKVIHALLLLEGLVKQKIPFVFKGGTALMLHFNSSKRLSIDIDIIISEIPENLDELLGNVSSQQGFVRKESQLRNANSKIEKAHYKFFYNPYYKTSKEEEYVLLDILFEEVQYKNLVELSIKSSFLPDNETPLTVISASIEDLAGDKLTAFAPNTTGIPYYKGKDSMSMEIIKQLYDIGNLIDYVTDLETIKTTFRKYVTTELEYREMNTISEKDVLNDIYQTSLCIVTRGSMGKGDFNQLQQGIQQVSRFIFSESYHIEKATTHASKAAYIATLIKHNAKTIEKYGNPLKMKDWIISEPINTKLNKLKKSNPEAFYYWYKIYELENHALTR